MRISERLTAPVSLFYSYSKKDKALRDKLETHLSLLQSQGVISGWHDRCIEAGTEWDDAIRKNLEEASIILLLVSADFLATPYIRDVEVARAMERHEEGTARVIPVILRPVDAWETTPFGRLQALPEKGKAVTIWKPRDKAFANIAQGIRRSLEVIHEPKEAPPKSIRVSVTHYPPLIDYDSMSSGHQVSGLFADMLSIISNKNNLNIDFVPGRLSNRFDGLKSGKVDCVAGALYTFERAKVFDFASFSYLVKIVGVKRSCDTRIQTLADLRRDDIHVAVPRGGCAHEIIMLLLTEKDREERLTVLDSGSTSDVVSLVAQGNADIAVADSLSCYNYLNNASKVTGLSYVFCDYPLFVSPVGMIFPANKPQLRDWLTTELAEARNTMEFRQTEERVLRDFSQVVLRLPNEKMQRN